MTKPPAKVLAFTDGLEVLDRKIERLQATYAKLSGEDAKDWYETMLGPALRQRERLRGQARLSALPPPEIDRVAVGQRFAAAWTAAGGPRALRVWQSPDKRHVRVYAPGEAGYLAIGSDGVISTRDSRLLRSSLYPAWRQALDVALEQHRAERKDG